MQTPVSDSQRTATLTDAEWQIVLGALGEIPWRIANPVLVRLNQQWEDRAQAQQQFPLAQNRPSE